LLQLRYRRAWIGSIWLLVLVIVVASLVPQTGLESVAGSDKIGHVAAYFALTVLSSAVVTARKLPWVMALAIVLGLALEAAQTLVTATRTADWTDVLANTTGVLTAWWLVRRRAGWALAAEAWLAGLRRH
jgi:VanZ family protein